MSAYGLSNDACEFMSSYLCDRYQRVTISNNNSSRKKMLKGILQGSGLATFLFNVFLKTFSILWRFVIYLIIQMTIH